MRFDSPQPPQMGHYDDGPISPYAFSPPSHTSIPFHPSRQSHSSSLPVSTLASRTLYPLHPPPHSSSLQSLLPFHPVSVYSLANPASVPYHPGYHHSVNVTSHTPLPLVSDSIHSPLSFSHSPHVLSSISPKELNASTPCRKPAFSFHLSSPSTSASPHPGVSPSIPPDIFSRED